MEDKGKSTKILKGAFVFLSKKDFDIAVRTSKLLKHSHEPAKNRILGKKGSPMRLENYCLHSKMLKFQIGSVQPLFARPSQIINS